MSTPAITFSGKAGAAINTTHSSGLGIALKSLVAQGLRAMLFIMNTRESSAPSKRGDVALVNRMANEIENSAPSMASELRAIASRD